MTAVAEDPDRDNSVALTEDTNVTLPEGTSVTINDPDAVTDDEAKNAELAATPPDEMVKKDKAHFDVAPVTNPAHPVDENPLKYVGDEEPDPWGKPKEA